MTTSNDAWDRRRFLTAGATLGVAAAVAPRELLCAQDTMGTQKRRPRPTAAQLAWQRDELALFVHFGINTFTDREWGDGSESPRLFAPGALDCRQWARTARAAGARAMILTAKHHDGFCLWPTRTTTHSVASSPWRDGKGDVVQEFVDACRAEGLKAGLYCSPWDRNHPAYGDSARYNDVYAEQLTELLTNYGPLNEVWFDGANGEGPNGKRQTYDWPRTWALVRRLQPQAVIFSDAGPDVRWIGNERGVAGETCWSTIRSSAVPYIGASGDEVITALQQGHADGDVWRPGETDVSIRPGWFYHPAEDDRVRSVDNLLSLWFTSVGRNSKLLLNVPPTREGLFHATDAARLLGLRERLRAMQAAEIPLHTSWRRRSATLAECTIRLPRGVHASVVELSEEIGEGQQVNRWTLSSPRHELVRGTTVGYKQMRPLAANAESELTLRIEALDRVPRVTVRLYRG